MTTKEIEARKQKVLVKFEIAKQIRDILDQAEKAYGKDAWTEDDMETEISQLVFEE